MRKKKRRSAPICEISLTPLCDVSLVLLIVLMVITPFIIQASLIDVSRAGAPAGGEISGSPEESGRPVRIHIEKDLIYVGDEASEDIPGFLLLLKAALSSGSGEAPAFVTAVSEVSLGRVVTVLDLSRKNGAPDIFLQGGFPR